MLVKTSPSFSLTSHLLSAFPTEYTTATQHPFLLAAAEGRLPKDVLSKWLANDRLYIHSYIRAAGKLLSSIDLPQTVPKTEAPETQLVDWLIEALAGVRREEKFFIDVAGKYGLGVDLGVGTESVGEGAKLPGLVMIEGIFGEIIAQKEGFTAAELPPSDPLPWLEGAVTFWGTERCYLDAWSWAKSKQALAGSGPDAREDADGGALRNEFIPNWSSMEFARFVERLGGLIDFAVAETIERAGDGADAARDAIIARVEGRWKSLLAAEATFWPDLE
ncbi:hypothetical protein B0T14DRAFT_497039 [Immersiella caudata]|uniref:Thiaminase-2/PQQC domain-containing protein n=1 Tax=Immersiella caudata TaxID=314043 RepID=A0AA40C076_9PEZI|nr:hypothetical protein B0T14DRAFT_497039 [Immersiella caudata]